MERLKEKIRKRRKNKKTPKGRGKRKRRGKDLRKQETNLIQGKEDDTHR